LKPPPEKSSSVPTAGRAAQKRRTRAAIVAAARVLIAEGQSNKEIASKLGIGVRTIETHRERIMRRLDIHSVAGLTKFAIANGLVTLEGERLE